MAKSVNSMSRMIINAYNQEFPRTWSTNTLTKHKEIYKLMKEYDELAETYNQATPSARRVLEDRMNKIEEELVFNYFIIKSDELSKGSAPS